MVYEVCVAFQPPVPCSQPELESDLRGEKISPHSPYFFSSVCVNRTLSPAYRLSQGGVWTG